MASDIHEVRIPFVAAVTLNYYNLWYFIPLAILVTALNARKGREA